MRRNYKPGDWTVVMARMTDFLTMEDVLLEHAFELCEGARPDISVGLCWSKWIKGQPPIGKAPLYLPNTGVEVQVNVYPASIRQDFEVWYEENYIYDKMRSYLQGKFKKMYGEIPTDSVAHHFSMEVTGKTCPRIPPVNLKTIAKNGGKVKAGQILVGLPKPQQMLPFCDDGGASR